MRRSDFDYHLPDELIAQAPPPARSAGRMLCLEGDEAIDRAVTDLPGRLRGGDLLVFNDTRVIPARLRGRHDTGGRFEIMIERLLSGERAIAQIRSGKPLRRGDRLPINGSAVAEVMGREGGFHELRFHAEAPLAQVLDALGEVPLPPYIRRPGGELDRERYQTIFARREGAVAAPTAGLHFDDALLGRLRAAGVESAAVTLHVGAGTFQPVRTEELADHVMHTEWMEVGAEACRRIEATRARGGRVVAVGTTVARALETASRSGAPEPFSGETALFITPGYRFRAVDLLFTNFHTPRSTLLMLVCAFAGTERVLAAYRHAVRQGYRFFSYGDAMLVGR
jgi:S-adenosylmethionine:tRNA ribosyltransferase-isomerase